MPRPTHTDASGNPRMVDVGGKPATKRHAVAEAFLIAPADVIAALRTGETPKGAALHTAGLAGVMAAKRTADLIPLCHPLPLDHVHVDFDLQPDRVRVVATAAATAPTGVEMEALTAAAVAALTLYDMLKALAPGMTISGLRLLRKSGGRSGEYVAADPQTTGGPDS